MWSKRQSCKQMAFAVLLLMLVLFVSPTSAGASGYNDWTGVWATNYGELKLEWKKDSWIGTFGETGTLVGTAADPWSYVIRGTWSNGKTSGQFEFRMDDNMKSFQGWRNSPGNHWKGMRDTVPEHTD